MSDNANYSNEESILNEDKAFNLLIITASVDALRKLYKFQDVRIKQLKYNNVEKYEQLFQDLIIEMREDLYGKEEEYFLNYIY